MNYDFKIETVLEDELYTTPPLMKVLVAKVIGTKQDIPKIFRLTKNLVSNAELKHLRRIRDLENGDMECIICKLDTSDDIQDISKKFEEQFALENLFTNYHSQLVPSKAPRTEHQWAACTKLWPCKYAKSNYLIQCIEGTVFDSAERLVLKIIVDNLIEHFRALSANTYKSCAVIFRFDKVYGVGLTSSKVIEGNPTKHSPMLAIDSVAKNVGAGHWRHTNFDAAYGLAEKIQQQLGRHHHELQRHKMDPKFLPYLCTNYDIIVTEEPCMMCTMGLVQSRIRRLFYFDSRSIDSSMNMGQTCFPDGAIEQFLVHRDKNLNHRFEAWRIKLEAKPPT